MNYSSYVTNQTPYKEFLKLIGKIEYVTPSSRPYLSYDHAYLSQVAEETITEPVYLY